MSDLLMCNNEACGIRGNCYRFIKVPDVGQKYGEFKFAEASDPSGAKYYACHDYIQLTKEQVFQEEMKEQTVVSNIVGKEIENFIQSMDDLGQTNVACYMNGWELIAKRVDLRSPDA